MDKGDKIAVGILVVIVMGLMFVFGAISQTIYNRHTVRKMGLIIIELNNKVEDYKIESKQWCNEQIEKIAC